MSRDGWLPPGVTNADIDRAAPGQDEPPFYCSLEDMGRGHCADFGYSQCWECASKEINSNGQ